MNYEPNTITWQKGDLVLHDCDAKQPKMLMKVIGYTREGKCKTQYLFRDKRRTVWKNEIKYLHSPEQWFQKYHEWGNYSQDYLEGIQRDFERVKRWNRLYQPGQKVITTSADGNGETFTKGLARFEQGKATIYLADTDLCRFGWWSLEFVKAIKSA